MEFSQEHPGLYKNWYFFSKAITLLAVPDENSLRLLIAKLGQANIKFSIFIEPDIENQITAIAIAPSEQACKLCSSIPLALREYNTPGMIYKHSVENRKEAQV